MKRLFKRYRKLLNKFFVAVVVSVCLINTVSLDAQAAASFTSYSADVAITAYNSNDVPFNIWHRVWGNSVSVPIPKGTTKIVFSVHIDLDTPIPPHNVFTSNINLYLTNTAYIQILDYSCDVEGLIPYWNVGSDPHRQRYFELIGSSSTGENTLTDFLLNITVSFLTSSASTETMYLTSLGGGFEYWSDESASIGSTIKDNTDKLVQGQNETNNKLDNITNGYDSSSGDSASGKLDGSASDFEQAEGSIFDSAQGHLKDFEFFDFNSIPAVVTGLSFVTSSMTAVFDAMGGLSGAGIVLSVLFAVMFLSIVIGLYRYFK